MVLKIKDSENSRIFFHSLAPSLLLHITAEAKKRCRSQRGGYVFLGCVIGLLFTEVFKSRRDILGNGNYKKDTTYDK